MSDESNINEIIQVLGGLFERTGKSPVTGKVMGILHFKSPITQEKIKEEVGCSLSAVSQSMKYLKDFGLIKSEKSNNRKKLYSLEFSQEKIKNALQKLILFGIDPLINFLDEKEKKIQSTELKNKTKNLKKAYSSVKNKLVKAMEL